MMAKQSSARETHRVLRYSLRALLPLALTVLAACQTQSTLPDLTPTSAHQALVCAAPERFAGKSIGDGHCVSLIKKCAKAPNTAHWRPGPKVLSSKLLPGTVIATFSKDRYPNKSGHHAAIYIKHDRSGIWVWDQWQGKPVHKRLIRKRSDRAHPGNTAQAYRVVQLGD